MQFALERLHMEDLHPREEQLHSIKAVYDGLNVFVSLPTGFGKVFVSRPFLSWWTSSWAELELVLSYSSVSSRLPGGWPGWGLEKEEGENFTHHIWQWFGQTPLSWRDKLMYRLPAILCTWSSRGELFWRLQLFLTGLWLSLQMKHIVFQSGEQI